MSCCDCWQSFCRWLTEQTNERRPLLSGQGVPRSDHNRRSFAADQQPTAQSRSGSGGSETRQSNTVRDGLFPAVMKPVKVSSVDKRLQDHATLYNIHLDRWNHLNEKVKELRVMFPVENPQSTLRGTFIHLHNLCRNCSSFSVTRPYAYCLEIIYEGREIPYKALPAIISFNLANRTIKEIIDKGPSVVRSIQMVLSSSKELCREVRVASLGPGMKDALENCTDDLELLEIVLLRLEEMETLTKRMLDEFLMFQSNFHSQSA